METQNIKIAFEDVSFQYDAQAQPTLHHISLKIKQGEKIVIVGPSGSGKSTLGHAINGLIPHYYEGEFVTGELLFDGAKLQSIDEHSADIGTVLQDPDAQFIGMTVGEDIAFALENDNIPLAEMIKRVEVAASGVGMEEFLFAKPHDLSGGQKQKISLAGVMVNDVDVVLYDEPLASLDPQSGKATIEIIDKLHHEKNLTTIIIEHRLEEVLSAPVDRIIVVDGGKIIADLSPDQLLKSTIVADTKLREPLYIAALKYAGVSLDKIDDIQDVKGITNKEIGQQLSMFIDEHRSLTTEIDDEVILELENINFSYLPDRPLLRDINFKINRGEMVSIVGANGAGKSTISKLICGFIKPQSGKIAYAGFDMKEMVIAQRAEKIGLVLQNPNQMISKTKVSEEVALGLVARGVPEDEIEKRVIDVLEICGLHPFRNWPISALSFGQKKRVTIASILVLEPEILIVDEPTAGQDYFHYTEIMQFLKKINREKGISILFITHDMHLMIEYTDRALVFADGVLLADSLPEEVLGDTALIKKAALRETSLHVLADTFNLDATLLVHAVIEHEEKGGI